MKLSMVRLKFKLKYCNGICLVLKVFLKTDASSTRVEQGMNKISDNYEVSNIFLTGAANG